MKLIAELGAIGKRTLHEFQALTAGMTAEELRRLVPEDAEGSLLGTRYEPVLDHFWTQEWLELQDSVVGQRDGMFMLM